MSPDKPQEPLSLESLEAQLRSLPSPKVPEGLEARLIAAIPAAGRTGAHNHLRWLAAGTGLAAGLLLAIGLLLPSGLLTDRASRPGDLRDTSPQRVVRQTQNDHERETRPCNILPPLPSAYCSSC